MLSRSRLIGLAMLAAPLVALGCYIGDRFVEDDNFRVATTDLFRPGQLRTDEWQESFSKHHYRSVLNLRGVGPGQSWYVEERGFAQTHGLVHYDVALSAYRAPTMAQMDDLVGLMRAAPKPLLIHCNYGSDRTGLVAALYRYAIDRVPAAEADRQLSFWYGHFPWLTSRTGAMDQALALFVAAHPADQAMAALAGPPRSATPPVRLPTLR